MVHSRQVKVQPAHPQQLCVKCMEPGEHRSCCGSIVCEHCYDNPNKVCPACHRSYQITDYAVEGRNFSEKEECRRCLEHGRRRRCCGEYYCDACYHMGAYCPSCQKPISTRGLSKAQELRNTSRSVLLGYCISITLITAMIAGFAVMLSNELLTPKTLFGFRCRGFYPTCPLSRCIDMDGGKDEIAFKSLKHWRFCDEKTENKVRGRACVFDRELYDFTDADHGFDFCIADLMRGVFVFEDLFEHAVNLSEPMSTTMRSAKWDRIVNGRVTTDCTVGSGEYSLAFSGPSVREAVTTDMDVRYGGVLQFMLRLAPLGQDSLTSRCATSFQGIVFVQYSVDEGASWTTLAEYDAPTFRGSTYHEISLKLPAAASTSATRFRWMQENFEDRRDHWALDNVRIEHYLERNWRHKKNWQNTRQDGLNWMQKIECCFDTDLCDTWRKKRDYGICETITAWRKNSVASRRGTTDVKGAELYIVIAIAVLGVRVLYSMVRRFLMGDSNLLARLVVRLVRAKVLPAFFEIQQGHYDQVHTDPDKRRGDDDIGSVANASKLKKTFKPRCSRSWQWGFAAYALGTLGGVFVLTSWAFTDRIIVQRFVLYGGTETSSEMHSSFVLLCAIVLDAATVWTALARVVCVYKGWQPRVTVDISEEVNAMFVDGYIIPLSQISESQVFGRRFVRLCAAGYVWVTFPWAMLGLLLSDIGLEYEAARVMSVAIGLMTCLRALLGIHVVIKFGFVLEYAFRFKLFIRDAVGAALAERRTMLASVNAAIAAVVIGFSLCVTIALELLAPLIGVFLVAGALYGMLTGCVHALPISPWIALTSLPDDGVWLRVQKKERCPCVYWGSYCTEMHRTDEVLIIPLANQIEFMDMIIGRIGG